MAKTLKQRWEMIFGAKKRHAKKRQRQLQFELERLQLIQDILYSNRQGITAEAYTDHQVIVSLTSFGKRVRDVALTIASLMRQTMPANRIILWLEDALSDSPLPEALVKLQQRGLEIRFCKDIRSYKKIIPALHAFPDAAIITVDDDVIYDYEMLEGLIKAHQLSPDTIFCHRMHRMVLTSNHTVAPYHQWQKDVHDLLASPLNFPVGIGGVLYPPHSLDEEVLNETVFTDICPYADDIWLKAMALRKGTVSRKATELPDTSLLNGAVQDVGLSKINTHGKNLNDTQLKAVFEKYNLYNIIK